MIIRLFFLSFIFSLFTIGVSQNLNPYDKHKIRVKFKRDDRNRLKRNIQSSTANLRNNRSGIRSIDQINKKHIVKNLRQLHHTKRAGLIKKHEKYDMDLWYEIEVEDEVTAELIAEYQADEHILIAEPIYEAVLTDHNTLAETTAVVNDPKFAEQWHYENTGQTDGTVDADIDLEAAWGIETGDESVIVAIMDAGIQVDHEDLAEAMWVNKAEANGIEGVDDDGNGYIDDINGYNFYNYQGEITTHYHGTHISGTVGAVSNNGIGVAGVAGGNGTKKGVKLMACQIFSSQGYSAGGYSIAQAYVYSADNGAVISQNSWSFYHPSSTPSYMKEAIDYFIETAGTDDEGNQTGPMKGGIVIFASGNNGGLNRYAPAEYEKVIAVASTNNDDEKSDFANYADWVDIAAPGKGIISTDLNNSYSIRQGTSMACPHVSGVAALIVSKYKGENLTPDIVRKRLLYTTDNVDHANDRYPKFIGTGRLNAYSALLDEGELPPNVITDLTITDTQQTSITLQWTAPTNTDGIYTTNASYYELRYSTEPITKDNFESAVIIETSKPKNASELETLVVDNLLPFTQYYFALTSGDIHANKADISNVATTSTLDASEIEIPITTLSLSIDPNEIKSISFEVINNGTADLVYAVEEVSSAYTSGSAFIKEENNALVAAVSNGTIDLSINAANYAPNNYTEQITITTNDPLTPTVYLMLSVHVNGTPDIDYPASINFGEIYTNQVITKSIKVKNNGTDTLKIYNVTSSSEIYTVEQKAVELYIGDSAYYDISIASDEVKAYEASTFILQTNLNATPSIQVFGGVITSPVSIEELEEDLLTGFTDKQNIKISNEDATTGISYDISIQYGDSINNYYDASIAYIQGIDEELATILTDGHAKRLQMLSTEPSIATLDSFELLIIHHELSSLSNTTIETIRTWVKEGHNLAIYGGEDVFNSVEKANDLLFETGITLEVLSSNDNTYSDSWDYFYYPDHRSSPKIFEGSYLITSTNVHMNISNPAVPLLHNEKPEFPSPIYDHAVVASSYLGKGKVLVYSCDVYDNNTNSYFPILAKSLDWLIEPKGWLSTNTEAHTLSLGRDSTIQMDFSSKGLKSGEYHAQVHIHTNNEVGVNNYFSIPVFLRVFEESIVDANGSIQSQANENAVFPNPSDGNFGIKVNSKVSEFFAKIYTQDGRLVSQKNITKTNGSDVINFDISNSPNGVYYINIESEGSFRENFKAFIKR